MVAKSTSLIWNFDAAVGQPVASVAVDFSTGSPWSIDGLQGAVHDGHPVNAKWLTVDNYANGNSVTVIFSGLLSFAVAPFTRKTFQLPGISNTVSISGTGTLNLYFWAQPNQPTPDDANLLSIQQTVAGGVTYPFRSTITVATPQASGDQNKRIVFAPVAADMDYTLLDLTTLANGWESRSLYNAGTKKVSLKPNGAQTINAIYTNAAPLILSPGDVLVDFATDSTVWYAHGSISFESAEIAIGANTTIAHGLGVKPEMALWMRCKTGELGYTAGQEVMVSDKAFWIATQRQTLHESIIVDATNIILESCTDNAARYLSRADTGVQTVITNGNWRYFFRAKARI